MHLRFLLLNLIIFHVAVVFFAREYCVGDRTVTSLIYKMID